MNHGANSDLMPPPPWLQALYKRELEDPLPIGAEERVLSGVLERIAQGALPKDTSEQSPEKPPSHPSVSTAESVVQAITLKTISWLTLGIVTGIGMGIVVERYYLSETISKAAIEKTKTKIEAEAIGVPASAQEIRPIVEKRIIDAGVPVVVPAPSKTKNDKEKLRYAQAPLNTQRFQRKNRNLC